MKNSLISWSIQDIFRIYSYYGKQLNELARIKKSIKLNGLRLDIDHYDLQHIFIVKFQREVNRINRQLMALDKEISRRDDLIGVMG